MQESSHSISFRHSQDVKYTNDFHLAEQLGKVMSGKENLPNDLKLQDKGAGFFEMTEKTGTIQSEILEIRDDEPIPDSVSVDASSIENPGRTEYRGVHTGTKQVIFEIKYDEATNNIGEFLAIVHALALYGKEGKELKVIYGDSLNAISWVKQKKCKTKFKRTDNNSKVFDHIHRAVTS